MSLSFHHNIAIKVIMKAFNPRCEMQLTLAKIQRGCGGVKFLAIFPSLKTVAHERVRQAASLCIRTTTGNKFS